MHNSTDAKKPAGDSNPTAGSTDRAIVPNTASASKMAGNKASARPLDRLHSAINHALLRAWCAAPSGWGRGTIRPGAEHTKSEAADLPDSEVFSRPEFMVLGVGSAYPQGRRHRFGGVFKPHVHPAGLNNRRMVFVTPEGVKAMPTSPVASRSAAPASPTHLDTTGPDLVQLHLQACNALAQALHTLRTSDCTASDLHRAIGRTLRAATAIKRMAGEVGA